jgi:O-methyltransferase
MWLHPNSENTFDDFDWVRNNTFELVISQIKEKNISGSIAELGVYRGDQASITSKLFTDRPFYLFDTFEGFSQIDIQLETGRFSESSTSDFSDTSLEIVLSKLTNPQRCIIKKGFFPETAKGLETSFCFVSLDFDLYAPTLAGLKYFYPRLARGGAIFVHDYNNIRYKDVKQAVDEYLDINYCPSIQIPDSAGSIIILK